MVQQNDSKRLIEGELTVRLEDDLLPDHRVDRVGVTWGREAGKRANAEVGRSRRSQTASHPNNSKRF